MNEADALEIIHRTIVAVLLVSGPMVFAAMLVGIIVALFQALTQVQEMTLTFVPKIVAMFVAFGLSSAFIGSQIQNLTSYVYARIQTGF
jgi:flagellar biosynthetic protein FliQ